MMQVQVEVVHVSSLQPGNPILHERADVRALSSALNLAGVDTVQQAPDLSELFESDLVGRIARVLAVDAFEAEAESDGFFGASAIKCWWLPRNPLAC